MGEKKVKECSKNFDQITWKMGKTLKVKSEITKGIDMKSSSQ